MGENKDYKDLIILGIVAIGISVAWFAYLVYIRDREVRDKMQPLSQNLSPLTSTQTEIPIHPVYDEKLYQLLESQQGQLEHINSNINDLRLNYTQYKMPYQKDIVNKPTRAGNITTLKTTDEDKARQHGFGMI